MQRAVSVLLGTLHRAGCALECECAGKNCAGAAFALIPATASGLLSVAFTRHGGWMMPALFLGKPWDQVVQILEVHKHPSPQLETGQCLISSLTAMGVCLHGWGTLPLHPAVFARVCLELTEARRGHRIPGTGARGAVNCWVDSAWTELGTPFHLYSFSVSSVTTGWENKSFSFKPLILP